MVEVCSQSHGWRRCLGNARGVRLGWELGDLGENRRSKEEELLGVTVFGKISFIMSC